MNVQHITGNFMSDVLARIGEVAELTLGQVSGRLALEYVVPVHGYDQEYEFRLLAYKVGEEDKPPIQIITTYDFKKVRLGRTHEYAVILANQIVKELSRFVSSAGELHRIATVRPYNAYMRRKVLR